jgi:hypothetical protein
VIAKTGTERSFVDAELALRQSAPELPVPRLVRVGPAGDWFSEAFVRGTPLNRIPDTARREEAFESVRSALADLARRTAERTALPAYLSTLVERLEAGLGAAPLLAADRVRIGRIGQTLAALARGSGAASVVITAQTHGDFQPGNVLVGDERTWLIDWEYTARRDIAFDALTYALGTRPGAGLARRTVDALRAENRELEEMLRGWRGVEWHAGPHRRRVLATFLLEELLVRIRENVGARLQKLIPGTGRFLDEVETATRHLATARS